LAARGAASDTKAEKSGSLSYGRGGSTALSATQRFMLGQGILTTSLGSAGRGPQTLVQAMMSRRSLLITRDARNGHDRARCRSWDRRRKSTSTDYLWPASGAGGRHLIFPSGEGLGLAPFLKKNPARTHSLAKPNERMGRTHQHMLLTRTMARYGFREA
jgi:hypothetical protein